MSVKVPVGLDWDLVRIWSAYAKLGVSMHDLETLYCLDDLRQFHQVLDLTEQLDRKLAAKSQGVEQVHPKGST